MQTLWRHDRFGKKTKWKSKRKTLNIIKKILRCKCVLPMKEVMKAGGVYKKQMKNMAYHKTHVKLLGKMHVITSRQMEAFERLGTLLMAADFAFKYSPNLPNCSVHSEFFGQDQSMITEGRTVRWTPALNNSEGIDST